MKLHISRVTISCPKGFVFLPFRPYWSSSPNHTLRLDCCTWWKLQHGNAKSCSVKALFWNDALHHFTNECHSRPSSCQDARGCREPAAPAGAHSQEQCDGDNDIDRAACRGTAAPHLLACSTPCAQLVLMWKQKPTLLHPKGKLPCAVDAQHFLKTNGQLEKVIDRHAPFSSARAYGCFRSNQCDTLVLFGKSLRTRIVRYD